MNIKNTLIKRLYENGDLPKNGAGIDLGFGGGEDILFLSSHGMQMIGVEKNKKSYDSLLEKISVENSILLLNENILNYKFKPDFFDVVIINNVLPFLSKENAVLIIEKSINSLKNNGYLLLTVFGPKDGWSADPDMSFFDFDEITSLFEKSNKVVVYFKSTEEGPGLTRKGDKKYWHIHRFILQRK